MPQLSRNEEMILLSIWKLADNAYGVTIRKNFMEMTRQILHFGSLYNTLERLSRKGLVTYQESCPESKKGGRRKKLYCLTPDGKKALMDAQSVYQSAWRTVSGLEFKGK